MKIIITVAAAAALTAAFASTAFAAEMSAADCDGWFVKADGNTDGSLGGEEAVKFNEKLNVSKSGGMSAADSPIIKKEVFLEECQKGTFEGLQPM
jgi:hypothetical protein